MASITPTSSISAALQSPRHLHPDPPRPQGALVDGEAETDPRHRAAMVCLPVEAGVLRPLAAETVGLFASEMEQLLVALAADRSLCLPVHSLPMQIPEEAEGLPFGPGQTVLGEMDVVVEVAEANEVPEDLPG